MAVVGAGERSVAALLAVDLQPVEVECLPRRTIMAIVRIVVAKIFIGDTNQVGVLFVVGQFVDGVGHAVGFDDQVQRRVGAAYFEQPCFPEPPCGIQHDDVGQFVVVERRFGSDLAHQCLRWEGVELSLCLVGGYPLMGDLERSHFVFGIFATLELVDGVESGHLPLQIHPAKAVQFADEGQAGWMID